MVFSDIHNSHKLSQMEASGQFDHLIYRRDEDGQKYSTIHRFLEIDEYNLPAEFASRSISHRFTKDDNIITLDEDGREFLWTPFYNKYEFRGLHRSEFEPFSTAQKRLYLKNNWSATREF